MKLCECGCGNPTRLAQRTREEFGHVKNEPMRFLPGHNMRLPEARQQRANMMAGYTHSDATRKKMAAAPRASGAEHPGWKGGRLVDRHGYVWIYAPEHPAARTKKYVAEHRLVMEQTIGRYLLADEEVHHRNGVRDDNLPENLTLMRKREHSAFHLIARLKTVSS